MTVPMARRSLGGFERWAFAIAPSRPDHHGRMDMSKRSIGSIRRECLDHVIIWGEAHLRQVLKAYTAYYNATRTHLGIDKDTPNWRPIERCGVVANAVLGGSSPSLCADIVFGRDRGSGVQISPLRPLGGLFRGHSATQPTISLNSASNQTLAFSRDIRTKPKRAENTRAFWKTNSRSP